jgi:hypothetical protein
VKDCRCVRVCSFSNLSVIVPIIKFFTAPNHRMSFASVGLYSGTFLPPGLSVTESSFSQAEHAAARIKQEYDLSLSVVQGAESKVKRLDSAL